MSRQSGDAISCATSVGEIIAILATRGCPDLTERINWDECGSLPIAGGGFCDIYRGELYNGAKIAIRSLRIFDPPGEDNQTAVLKNAAKELYHWSKLRHPNVLPLMGLAIYRGQISMVSEWMSYGNLSRYLVHHPEADRLALCQGICAGLQYIHSQGMVHGDIKAANVMVSPGGVAIIADFGNARLKELTIQFTGTTHQTVSLRWAAPELLMIEGSKPSIHSDIYAFGMTALETSTGEIPFKNLNDTQLTFQLLGGIARPSRPTNGVSNDVWRVLQSCWAQAPKARPSLATVMERLSEHSPPEPGFKLHPRTPCTPRRTALHNPNPPGAFRTWPRRSLVELQVSPHKKCLMEASGCQPDFALPSSTGGYARLLVSNMPDHVQGWDLEELFRKSGTVLRADTSLANNRS